jgi:hypothetical protein
MKEGQTLAGQIIDLSRIDPDRPGVENFMRSSVTVITLRLGTSAGIERFDFWLF